MKMDRFLNPVVHEPKRKKKSKDKPADIGQVQNEEWKASKKMRKQLADSGGSDLPDIRQHAAVAATASSAFKGLHKDVPYLDQV